MNRVLVLGVGNLILGDDGLGIHLVRHLQKHGGFPEHIDFMESEEIGLSILDMASGYDTLLMVDAIQSEDDLAEGTIIYVTEDKYDNLSGWGSHYIGFFEMKDLAHRSGIPFPEQLHILGVVVNDPFRIDWELSPNVQRLLPDISKKLEATINELCGEGQAIQA